MIPVLSRAQMRAFDERAIQGAKVPGVVLMENAGRGAAEVIARRVGRAGFTACVVAGPGNNGGDGLVVARHLFAQGTRVHVLLTAPESRFGGDAKANLDAMRGVGIAPVVLSEDMGPLRVALAASDVIVDAIFGTGLDRPVAGVAAAAIGAMNEARALRVALDLPSGLDADRGVTLGVCFHADATVTFGHYKLGLLTPHGARMAGMIDVASLGVPSALGAAEPASAQLLEARDVATTLGRRGVDQYKNSAGHVAILAGSPGHIGAALMSAHGALRAGAGLVTIATWEASFAAVASRVVEVMAAPIDPEHLAESVDRVLEGKRAVVIGPGFGLDTAARAVVEHVLRTYEGPTVFDADALSMFEESPQVFASSKGAPVLTPHPGELGRLLGTGPRDIEADRYGAIRQAVDRARCVVVLKGAHTLVSAPDEPIVVNASGNPAMATGGSGDVLSGIIGALLCTADPFDAACAGVHLHGAAADAWRDEREGADRGLFATEIADALPRTMARLTASAHTHGGMADLTRKG